MMSKGVCRGCRQDVIWIKTTANKMMICDPKLVIATGADQNLVLVQDNGVTISRPHVGITGYVPHFATCPQVDRFRKPRK